MQFGRFPDGPLLVEHLDTMISFVFTGLERGIRYIIR